MRKKKMNECVKGFLRFEKRKIILPIVLIVIFLFTVHVVSSIYYAQFKFYRQSPVLQNLKAAVYFGYYNMTNNTEKANLMKDKLDMYEKQMSNIQSKIGNETLWAEQLKDVFGFNTALLSFLGIKLRGYDYINVKEASWVSNLSCKMNTFVHQFRDVRETNNSVEIEQFITQHPIEKDEECVPEMPEYGLGALGLVEPRALNTLTYFHISFFSLILFIEGYLISCIIAFGYNKIKGTRKEKEILEEVRQKRGKK